MVTGQKEIGSALIHEPEALRLGGGGPEDLIRMGRGADRETEQGAAAQAENHSGGSDQFHEPVMVLAQLTEMGGEIHV